MVQPNWTTNRERKGAEIVRTKSKWTMKDDGIIWNIHPQRIQITRALLTGTRTRFNEKSTSRKFTNPKQASMQLDINHSDIQYSY